jgi:hypothetical protein
MRYITFFIRYVHALSAASGSSQRPLKVLPIFRSTTKCSMHNDKLKYELLRAWPRRYYTAPMHSFT